METVQCIFRRSKRSILQVVFSTYVTLFTLFLKAPPHLMGRGAISNERAKKKKKEDFSFFCLSLFLFSHMHINEIYFLFRGGDSLISPLPSSAFLTSVFDSARARLRSM